MRRAGWIFGVGLVLLTFAAEARAQVAWDSPMLLPPRPPAGLGLYLVEPAGGDLGGMLTWRSGGGPANIGFRVGVAEDNPDDDIAVFGGAEFTGLIGAAGFPLDLAWLAGVGLGVGDAVLVSVPFGLSVGGTIDAEGVRFMPYGSPRIVLDALFNGGEGDDSDLDLDVAVDLGVDFFFSPGWGIRVGGTLGDREAVAIGIIF